MAGEVRARMAESAVHLLAQRGLQATTFADVLERSGAARGSVYHHFPGGKDELVEAAVELADGRLRQLLDRLAGSSPLAITEEFLRLWRAVLSYSQFRAGCAVLAVTVAAESPAQVELVATVFREWRRRLAGLFEQGGVPSAAAARFAATLVASTEGAVAMSRAEQSMEPFNLVSDQLLETVRRLTSVPD